jgi:hypothetical protein
MLPSLAGLRPEQLNASLERFAREVAPRLRRMRRERDASRGYALENRTNTQAPEEGGLQLAYGGTDATREG